MALMEAGMDRLGKKGMFEAIVNNLRQKFCDNAEVEDGVAMNDALSENLFVTIVAMLNKLPCMIVGKPGSSKTLALQVILSNLQGDQSPNPFWQKFPAVTLFQFQCSPLSTAEGVCVAPPCRNAAALDAVLCFPSPWLGVLSGFSSMLLPRSLPWSRVALCRLCLCM